MEEELNTRRMVGLSELEKLGDVIRPRCPECGGLDMEMNVLPFPSGLQFRCRTENCKATAIVVPTKAGLWHNQKD